MARWAVSTAASSLEFDTVEGEYSSPVQVDANHFINFWSGDSQDGFVQVFTVNTTTWAVTTAAARLEFDTVNGTENSALKVDTNHFINFWNGDLNDGFVQTFTVNTTTWGVTTAAARLEFDTVLGSYNSAVTIDANHVINFWGGSGSDGFVQVFTVNTTTWAVTTAAARLEFDTVNGTFNAAAKIDDNHFINFWSGSGGDGFVQTFTVNTTTWAVTTAAARLEFDTQNALYISTVKIDDNHFLATWQGDADLDFRAQVFTVNTTTWAVTTAAAVLEITTAGGLGDFPGYRNMAQIDTNHFLVAWKGTDSAGSVQVLEVNTTSYQVFFMASEFVHDATFSEEKAILKVDTTHYVTFWSGDSFDGYVQTLAVDINYSPTSALNTADATETSDTTPTLDFTGTDAEVNSVRYTLQIDTANTFNSGSQQTVTIDHVTDLGSDIPTEARVAHATTDHENRILVVMITHDVGTPNDVNWVMYGGQNLTQAKESTYGGNKHAEAWYVINPAVGTHQVIINSDTARTAAVAYDIYNVDQTNPINATGSNQNTDDTPTTSITTTVDNCLIIDVLCSDGGGAAGASQTQRWTKSFSFNESRSSTKPLASFGTTTMTWGTSAGDWAMAAVALKPSTAPYLQKVSGTDDGFANPDTGGDTDPFNSGENIQYTVQSALSAGTYYWRVKAIDPTGSNLYGEWSSTRSFTIVTEQIPHKLIRILQAVNRSNTY